MAELRDGVALTELGVITRWSLAVRVPEAERAELIAELRADLDWLQGTPARTATLPAPPSSNELTQEIAAQRDIDDDDDEIVVDEPEPEPAARATATTPSRRLRKPAPAPAKKAAKPVAKAPATRAPAKAPAPRTGATRVPKKISKATAGKAVSAAPRGRRPASGG